LIAALGFAPQGSHEGEKPSYYSLDDKAQESQSGNKEEI
jgi:hypothetical protein